MWTLTPMIWYYWFLIFLLLLWISLKYWLDYLKNKKNSKK